MHAPSEDLSEQFVVWMDESVAQVEALVAAMDPEAPLAEDDRETVYGIAHNLKGMGSSFSYDLITEIGGLMCVYMKSIGTGAAQYDFTTLEALAKALRVVADHKITGMGGERGEALIKRLTALLEAQDNPQAD